MVQVDVFWSYGIGASFALGAFRQLRRLQAGEGAGDFKLNRAQTRRLERMVRKIESGDRAFNNQYFLKTLLFLSLLFVPSGSNLLWSNPNWETMQVGDYESIPGWLVSGFTITNVTQGILGYYVTYECLMRGKYHRAALQAMLAYLGFWFILVNGWDKTGYRRFFSRNREAFDNWKPSNLFGWLRSDVVRILLGYGAFFIPLMLYWISTWLQEGYEMEGLETGGQEQDGASQKLKISADFFITVCGITLGLAIVAHLLVRFLGWTLGSTAAAAAAYLLLGRKGPVATRLKNLMKVDDLEALPVWEKASENAG